MHAEYVLGDYRHFNNASDVFAACSEYIVEVSREDVLFIDLIIYLLIRVFIM